MTINNTPSRFASADGLRRQIRERLIYNREDLNRALTEAYTDTAATSVLILATDIILQADMTINYADVIIDGGNKYGFRGAYTITTAGGIVFKNMINKDITIAITALPVQVTSCEFNSTTTSNYGITLTGNYTYSSQNYLFIQNIIFQGYTNPIYINATSGGTYVDTDLTNIHVYV